MYCSRAVAVPRHVAPLTVRESVGTALVGGCCPGHSPISLKGTSRRGEADQLVLLLLFFRKMRTRRDNVMARGLVRLASQRQSLPVPPSHAFGSQWVQFLSSSQPLVHQ